MIPIYSQFAQIDHSAGKIPGVGDLRHESLWRGCVGAYAPILGASGNYWIDFTAYRHHGVRTNGLLWTNDGGYCGEFDGDNDFVELGTIKTNDPLQLSSGQMSISLWLNPDQTGDSFQRMIDKSDSGNASNGYMIYIDNNVGGRFGFGVIDSTKQAVTDQSFPTGWAHWVVTLVNGNPVKFYLNGVQTGYTKGAATNLTIPNVQTNMRFGTWNHSTGREYNGKMDDVRFYNRILTDREIRTLSQYRGVAYEVEPRFSVYYIPPPSGAISGSSTVSLTTSGSLTATGALSGDSAVSVTTSGAMVATGSMSGSSSVSFTSSATLTASGAMTGTSSASFTTSGDLTASGSLSGSSSVSISTGGSADALGLMTGSSSVSMATSGALTGSGTLSGSSQAEFTTSGDLSGTGALSGSSTVSFTTSGELEIPGVTPISGSSTVTFNTSGVLTATGSLSGESTVSITTDGAIFAPELVPTEGFLEYTLDGSPTHYTLNGSPAHYELDGEPAHYTLNGSPLHFELDGEPIHYTLQET